MLFTSLIYYTPKDNKLHIPAHNVDAVFRIKYCEEQNIKFDKPPNGKEHFYIKGVPLYNAGTWDRPSIKELQEDLENFRTGKIQEYTKKFIERMNKISEKYPNFLNAEVVIDENFKNIKEGKI